MSLVAIEPGEKNHASLVILRRRFEDFSRQRHSRFDHRAEGGGIASGKRGQRLGGGGRHGIEDAEQGVAVFLPIAFDQFGIVEIIAGEAEHIVGQTVTQGDLVSIVEQ
ncbi:hypothetical protein D3C87_1796550 [compost metagenome]